MDPITVAVLAALPALASGLVKDAYEGLKTVIRRKWGETDPLSKAVKALEEDPTSNAQAGVLAEKVKAAQADKDPDVVQALNHLVERLKDQSMTIPHAGTNVQLTMSGGIIEGVGAAGYVYLGNMMNNAQPGRDKSNRQS